MTWQPIETAPKDGTTLLVFDRNDGPVVAEWERHFGGMWTVSAYALDTSRVSCDPTHWMYLPIAPEPHDYDHATP
jgi:hypothetical protein